MRGEVMVRSDVGAQGWAPVAATAILASSCHLLGGGKAPWPASTGKTGVPFTHADVVTLNEGYQRTKSSVLVRQITKPTRAALDFAAYHANFMIVDPPPEDAPPAGKPDAAKPFGGNIEKESMTADIARTPLTESERAHPIAFAPAVEWLAEKKGACAHNVAYIGSPGLSEHSPLPHA